MNIETWARIRYLYLSEKKRICEIAAELSLDRKTVRKAISLDSFFRKQAKRASLLDPFHEEIQEILESSPKLSAVRIFEKLQEMGYQGQLTILRRYLRKVRPHKEPHLRLSVLPGMQAQVDWGHCGKLPVGSTTRPLYCFAMGLSYSRAIHVEFTLGMSMEIFLDAHVKAFEYFRGFPKEILYDNLSSVVLSRVKSDIRFNPRFMDFAGFYGFNPKPCNVRKPREKGRIEMVIKYIKQNFLAGRSFTSLADLRLQAHRWRDEIANVRIHSITRKRPVDLLLEEQPLLLPLPEKHYDTALKEIKICPPDCFLRFQTNDYSVPLSCNAKELLLKADAHWIKIYDGARLVAEHIRCWDKYQTIENPNHRKALLARQTRATFSKALDELSGLGPECDQYIKGLNLCDINVSHHVKRLLKLSLIYGATEFRQAIMQALNHNAFGFEYIENIIVNNRRRRYAQPPSGPIQIKSRPELSSVDVQPHSLEIYDLPEDDSPQ